MYGWDAGSGVRERYSETYAFDGKNPSAEKRREDGSGCGSKIDLETVCTADGLV